MRTLAAATVAVGIAGLGVVPASAGTTGANDPAGTTGAKDRTDFTLTVLHTNDVESQLLGVDADANGNGEIDPGEVNSFGSAARMATLWDRLKVESWLGFPLPWPDGATASSMAPSALSDAESFGKLGKRGVLSISGGDNYLAGPEFQASQEDGVPFYDTLAVDRLGLDVSAIGNHEFDFGPDTYADFIEGFDGSLPFVSANLDFTKEPRLQAYVDDGLITGTRVMKQFGEEIGVIGLTTPELPTISSPGGVKVLGNIAEIANAEAAKLAADGVDKVILVSHLQDIENEMALVPELSGVDAVLGAGGGEILADKGDSLIPGDVAEGGYPLWANDADGRRVPVATTTGDYKYIGKLTLRFDKKGALLGIDDEKTLPVRVSGLGADAVPKDDWTVENVEAPVAEHLKEMEQNVLADSEVGLDGVRANVRSRETNLGDVLADALLWAGQQKADEFGVPAPVLGIQNAGGIRNDAVIPPGPVTELDTFDVAPFTNFVSVLPEVPRDTVRQLLERGVAATPGASGAFIQIAGAKFTYDTSKQAQVVNEETGEIITPGERVQSVVLDDGTVLVENGQVVDGPAVPVATNDFSAMGGDAYPLADLPFTRVDTTYQEALRDYLTDALSGTVTAADYPEGGEGRIQSVG